MADGGGGGGYRRRAVERVRELWSQLTMSEVSGSLGDLGTLVPLLVASARQGSIALAPALFCAGVANVATGVLWDVPMCVQPMKSIAAVALSETLTPEAVAAAGICVGAIVFLLGATNAIEAVNTLVPTPVVSGLQIGVGLKLAAKGVGMVRALSWTGAVDSPWVAIILAVLCLYWLRADADGGSDPPTTRGHQCEADGAHHELQDARAPAGRGYGRVVDDDDDDDDGGDDGDGDMSDGSDSNRDDTRGDAADADIDANTTRAGGARRAHDDDGDQASSNREIDASAPAMGSSCALPPALAAACCCFAPGRAHPVGIYLFAIGAVFAAATLATTSDPAARGLPLRLFGADVVVWRLSNITAGDWKTGVLEGAIPQVPLTTLNSVISVCCVAHTLYPEKRRGAGGGTDAVVSRRAVSMSVGVMNLLLCPFGAMPACHGAGGLAAQHRMGARHGASVVFLGLAKILLAVFFGASAGTILDAVPDAVLGVMLAVAGQELVVTGVSLLTPSRGEAQPRAAVTIAVLTALIILSLGKTHYGAAAGWVAHMIHGTGARDAARWWRGRRETHTRTSASSARMEVV